MWPKLSVILVRNRPLHRRAAFYSAVVWRAGVKDAWQLWSSRVLPKTWKRDPPLEANGMGLVWAPPLKRLKEAPPDYSNFPGSDAHNFPLPPPPLSAPTALAAIALAAFLPQSRANKQAPPLAAFFWDSRKPV